MSPDHPHLVLVNLGTPTEPTPAAVHDFLAEFLSDPEVVDYPSWLWRPVLRTMVLRRRPERVAELYASIWADEGSPLRVETERLAQAVRVAGEGRFAVSTAYRYGEPSLATVMQRLARAGEGRIVVVPLFPQRTGATTGTAFAAAHAAAARAGVAHRLEARPILADAPGYVDAMIARWTEALAAAPREPEHLVVSFHGIPARYDRRERGTYVRDCRATMRAFLDAVDWPAVRARRRRARRRTRCPWSRRCAAERAGRRRCAPRRRARAAASRSRATARRSGRRCSPRSVLRPRRARPARGARSRRAAASPRPPRSTRTARPRAPDGGAAPSSAAPGARATTGSPRPRGRSGTPRGTRGPRPASARSASRG